MAPIFNVLAIWCSNPYLFCVYHMTVCVLKIRSVVEIWNFMSSYQGNKVLMGDMNTEPNSHTIRLRYFVFAFFTFIFNHFRFLQGSLSVNGVYTEDLKDVWDYAQDDDNFSGLTFSTLDDQLTKRVSYLSSCVCTIRVYWDNLLQIDYIFTHLLLGNTVQWVGVLDDKLRQ